MTTVRINADLLKELLKCLVANAIAATKDGSIEVVASMLPDQKTLRFDIIDTGIGISGADQQRIFVAFEKLVLHSRGSGPGLNLASQMAFMLKGTLSVVSSQPEVGSHFRLEVPYIGAASRPMMSDRKQPRNMRHLPSTYYVAPRSKQNLHLLSHLQRHLVQCGLVQSDVAQGALIITNRPEPFQEMLDSELRSLHGPHMVMLVSDMVATDYSTQCLRDDLKPHLGFPITGPLYTARLEEILAEADHDFATYCKQFPTSLWKQDTQLATKLNAIQINSSSVALTKSYAKHTKIEMFFNSSPRALWAQIVDDNVINLNVLQFFCKGRKIPYETATDGNKSFHKLLFSGINRALHLGSDGPPDAGVRRRRSLQAYTRVRKATKSATIHSIHDYRTRFACRQKEFLRCWSRRLLCEACELEEARSDYIPIFSAKPTLRANRTDPLRPHIPQFSNGTPSSA